MNSKVLSRMYNYFFVCVMMVLYVVYIFHCNCMEKSDQHIILKQKIYFYYLKIYFCNSVNDRVKKNIYIFILLHYLINTRQYRVFTTQQAVSEHTMHADT